MEEVQYLDCSRVIVFCPVPYPLRTITNNHLIGIGNQVAFQLQEKIIYASKVVNINGVARLTPAFAKLDYVIVREDAPQFKFPPLIGPREEHCPVNHDIYFFFCALEWQARNSGLAPRFDKGGKQTAVVGAQPLDLHARNIYTSNFSQKLASLIVNLCLPC